MDDISETFNLHSRVGWTGRGSRGLEGGRGGRSVRSAEINFHLNQATTRS